MYRLACFGDRHLAEKSPRYEHAKAIWRLGIAEAVTCQADAALGLGDVLEGWPNSGRLIEDVAAIYRYRKIPWYEVLGNHEDITALDWLETAGLAMVSSRSVRIVLLRSTEDAAPEAMLLLIPYPRRGHQPFHDLGAASIEESMQRAAERIGLFVAEAAGKAREAKIPLIVAGHFTVAGMRLGQSQYELHAADEVIVPLEAFAGASLVITGHIHHAQYVDGGPCPIISAGSLYRCSVAETDDEKSWVLVTIVDQDVSWMRYPVLAREMVSVSVSWREVLNGTAALPTPEAIQGKELFLEVTIPADLVDSYDPDERFRDLKTAAAYFKLTRITEQVVRQRAPELPTARDLGDELVIWARAIGEPIPEDREERLRAKVAALVGAEGTTT